MNTTHGMKKMIVAGLLSGGLGLAALGLTAGTASAAPAPGIDHSTLGAAGDGSVRVGNPGVRLSGDGSVRVANPGARVDCDGSVRVAIPAAVH